MANIKFTNFARTALAVGVGSGDVTMSVTGGTGALFPALTAGQYFYAVLENAALDREIVKVTARATDTFTVTRGQDSTTARAWVAGDIVSLRFVAAAISDAVVGTLLAANNLSDVGSAATARANLGALAAGDNIGSTTATTQSAGDNSTKVATTAFVRSVGPSYGSISGFSANTTLTSVNYGNFIYVQGTFTLTLPVADAANIGRTITCYGYAAASVTVATQSSQFLYYQGTNTTTSAVMIGVGDTVTFVNYSGTAWMAMGANALGTGQTWQSPGRSGGVTYYNTTGKPIFISVTSGSTGSGAGVNITVNGVLAAQVSGSALNRAIASAIVPTGGSYKADMLLGSALDAFTELR